MIGIDTNVLVRHLVQDDPRQAAAARRWLEKHCTRDRPGRVCLIVLCELVWVLTRAYGYEKDLVVQALRELLQTVELQVEQTSAARRALDDYQAGQADFSDYLIGHVNADAGAAYTVTFDRRAAAHRLFRLTGT